MKHEQMVPANLGSLNGYEVLTDRNLLKTVWEFPEDMFIEYEPKDEEWCRRLGFGKDVQVPDPNVFVIGRTILGHPATIDRLYKEMGKINAIREDLMTKNLEKAKKFADDNWWGIFIEPKECVNRPPGDARLSSTVDIDLKATDLSRLPICINQRKS